MTNLVQILTYMTDIGRCKMLVSEYVLQIIEKRPYKYSTKLTNVADVKRLGIWDMDTSEIHSGMIHERVDKIANLLFK